MINRANLKQHAKSSLSGKWGIAIGTLIVAEIILAAATLIPLGSIILTGVVSVGLIIVYLEIVRNLLSMTLLRTRRLLLLTTLSLKTRKSKHSLIKAVR